MKYVDAKAPVDCFRHARQHGKIDAKDIDLERRQIGTSHMKALLASI